MKKRSKGLAILCAAALSAPALAANWFVDDDADPGGMGNTWPEAFDNLQAALSAAASGDTIFVAQGVYKPGTLRTDSFVPAQGVTMRGGYIGWDDADPDQRDYRVYITILSGDIGVIDDNTDNSYHVMRGPNQGVTQIIVNGFTICDGRANGGGIDDDGGGVYHTIDMVFLNCTFADNVADDEGSGIYAFDPGDLTLVNCIFQNNTGSLRGGGVYMNGNNNSPKFDATNCLFIDNTAGNEGASIYVFGPITANVHNCTFSGNLATTASGVFTGVQTDTNLRNSVFWDNTGNSVSGQFQAPITLENCLIDHSIKAAWDLGGNIFPNTDPEFRDPANDDYRLAGDSPAIDAGEDTLVSIDSFDVNDDGDTDEETRDLDWAVRILALHSLTVDMGAYEFDCTLCTWDLNCDGLIDSFDLLILLGDWGNPYGTVDLLNLLGDWGPCFSLDAPGVPRSIQDCLDDFCCDELLALEACIEAVQ